MIGLTEGQWLENWTLISLEASPGRKGWESQSGQTGVVGDLVPLSCPIINCILAGGSLKIKLTASPLFSLWFLLVQLYAATLWACQEATFPTRTSQPLVSGQSPPLPDMEGENGHCLEKPEFWVGQMAPLGLPRWPSDKEPACQCRQCSFNPCIRKIPWSRKWCPTPVFLHREFYGPLGSLQSMGLQRVRHFWGTEHAMHGLDRITGSRG